MTEKATSVDISVNPRGLSPSQVDQVMDLVEALHSEHSGIPVQTPAEKAAIARAAKSNAGRIAEIVAMTD